jgi:UDP-N-acetyl-D-glucosamine dehydrogenase
VKPDIAIIGAGYVGMPHAHTFADAGKHVVLVDVQQSVVDGINRGESHIADVPSEDLKRLVDAGLITATTDFGIVRDSASVVIAVPTPLSPQREPDLRYIESAARDVAPHLKKGHVVVLESTTYPGTTREVLLPLLEEGSGLKAGSDFYLAFAPERVDPGRTDWTTKSTPKVVGGIDASSTAAAAELYRSALDNVHEVSTAEAAELTKLLENIFRSVNIALVNELAQLCDRMDIDVWEVIEAAATKPFGFMPFQPGPGLGGHCIPLDPYYLAWKAREFDFNTRFVELAGEINNNMPYFCRSVISQALNHGAQKSLKGSKILLVGVAYKADIDDVRESPAEKVLKLLRNAGADVAYHDPYVAEFDGLRSAPLDPAACDCVVIVTAHTNIDYDKLVDEANIVVDLRNATGAKGTASDKVFKL